MLQRILDCIDGKRLWERIKREWKSDHYIIMPHRDDPYNYYALLYLEAFVMKKKIDVVTIVCCDEAIRLALPYFTKRTVNVAVMKQAEVTHMARLQALADLSDLCTIVSLTIPYDTGAQHLLGRKGVTKRELLCYDIFKLSRVPKAPRPDYKGSNKKLEQFMSLETGETE